MIRTHKELKFYIAADEIMNEQVFPRKWYLHLLFPSPIQKFLRALRHVEYWQYKSKQSFLWIPIYFYHKRLYLKWKYKTGFDIPLGVLGYGCRIGHLSTIVINGATHIGNYCCLSNNIVIADGNPKQIGNHVQLGSNVVLAKSITIPDGCKVSSCSFVNRSCDTPCTLLGGVIAKPIKSCLPWTSEEPYKTEYENCEKLKRKMKLEI